MELGTHAIRICLVHVSRSLGFRSSSASYFQAVGKPKQALLLGFSRQVLLLIPAILIWPLFPRARRRLDRHSDRRFLLLRADRHVAVI